MKYTYLLINIATVFFPLVLSFDQRVAFYKSWKFIWPGMGITGILFLIWDVLFTVKGVWSFNPKYILGITLLGLPLEEILFFLTIPFACLFIYACLNHYVKKELPDFLTGVLSSGIIVYGVLNCCFNYQRLYTLVTFVTLVPLLILVQYVYRSPWSGRFYRAYLVALLPFYLVNGELTSIPVVLYNNAQNLGIRVGSIPLEDHFYFMALLLMNVWLYEWFKGRRVVG